MRRRLHLLIALLGAALAAFALAPAAHAASGDNYVALGDSYSSGVGSGSYTAESGSCDRSLSAYPALWAKAHSPASFTFGACSGATTSSVESGQLGGLTTSTTLVTITVGGNDEHFSTIMEDCNLYSDSTCVNEIQAAEDDARANLPGKLATLWGDIRTHAPSARIVVLDYPHFYDLSHNCIGLSQTKRTKIDEGIDVLDGILQNSASANGLSFADARTTFTGHEICDSTSWLHSIDWTNISDSYHPTASGQSGGYLPALDTVTG